MVELGSLIAGPFAGRLLADWGADVVKVESPRRPDPMRDWGNADLEGQQVWWLLQSRNKRSVAWDLATGEGRERLLALVARSDVLVENFRPGTLERWGLGPDQLWERNPGLVVARVSAYGQSGPRASQPGYASIAEALGGLRYLNGYPGQAPPRTGLSLGDTLGGMYAALGVLAALYWRDARGGRGQVVDTSLVESCFAMLESVLPEYAATGAIREPSGSGLAGIAPSNVFGTADGRWVIVAANQDTVFARLATAMDQPELADDPRFRDHRTRGKHQVEIEALVAEWAAAHTGEELTALLDAAAVPNGTVNSIADIVADPMFRERGMLVPVPSELGEVLMPGVVPKLSLTPGGIRWAGRVRPGQDDAEVESDLFARSHRVGT